MTQVQVKVGNRWVDAVIQALCVNERGKKSAEVRLTDGKLKTIRSEKNIRFVLDKKPRKGGYPVVYSYGNGPVYDALPDGNRCDSDGK